MREFGIIGSSIWRSRKFRALRSEVAKLVYFYLHTTTHGNSCGAFILPPEMAAIDMKISSDAIRAGYAELSEAGLVRYDQGEEIVQIRSFYRYNNISSRKHLQGPLRYIRALPACGVRDLAACDLVIAMCERAADWREKARRYRQSEARSDQTSAANIDEAISAFHQEAISLISDFDLKEALGSPEIGLGKRDLESIGLALSIPLSHTPMHTRIDTTDTDTDTENDTDTDTDTDTETDTDTDTGFGGKRGGNGLPALPSESRQSGRTIPPDIGAMIQGMKAKAGVGKGN